jgi:hypothetical protein
MPTTHVLAAATFLGLAGVAAGCTPPRPAVHAASAPEAALSVFVDPEASIGTVRDEKGRDVVVAFHDALQNSLKDAGYHVAASSADAHDLTVHLKIRQVGYTYRAWADDVVVEVTGGGQPVAEVSRPNVNWVGEEGATEPLRLAYAATVAVNDISKDVRVEQYSAHPLSTSPHQLPAPDAPAAIAPPLAVPAPAPAPAASPLAVPPASPMVSAPATPAGGAAH